MTMNFADHVTPLLSYLKDPLLLSWIVAGIFTIFLPSNIWSSNASEYYDSYGYYNEKNDYYEQEQEYYNQQQENNENQQDDGYYYGYQTYYEDCSWYNWACRKRQWYFANYDDNDSGDEITEEMPSWYVFLGGETEEMQRWKEENTGVRGGGATNPAGLKFVYALTIILFLALLGYGAITIGKKQPVTNLVVLLVVMTLFGLINMITSAQGISSDDKDQEDSYYGWYGQMGVLLVYTNFWIMIFSVGFCFAFLVKYLVEMFLEKKNTAKADINEPMEESGEYYAPAPVNQSPVHETQIS